MPVRAQMMVVAVVAVEAPNAPVQGRAARLTAVQPRLLLLEAARVFLARLERGVSVKARASRCRGRLRIPIDTQPWSRGCWPPLKWVH